jgi:hypothetical protein
MLTLSVKITAEHQISLPSTRVEARIYTPHSEAVSDSELNLHNEPPSTGSYARFSRAAVWKISFSSKEKFTHHG